MSGAARDGWEEIRKSFGLGWGTFRAFLPPAGCSATWVLK